MMAKKNKNRRAITTTEIFASIRRLDGDGRLKSKSFADRKRSEKADATGRKAKYKERD